MEDLFFFFFSFFFSRYLQERLKQIQEEVNLLKSNITKYKVKSSQCIYHLICALVFVKIVVHSQVCMYLNKIMPAKKNPP